MPNWSAAQDAELWRLYENNSIDSANSDSAYLFNITQEFFPEFVGVGTSGRNTAIRRLRNKNRIRNIQLNQAQRGGE